jgi:hypothetical protein
MIIAGGFREVVAACIAAASFNFRLGRRNTWLKRF